MPGYKFHYFDKSLIKSINFALVKSLNEDDNKTKTTPEEIAKRAYSDKPRSAGDVDPEFSADFDAAFAEQQKKFDALSPEAQKASILMWGDPKHPEYKDTEITVERQSLPAGKFGDASGRGNKIRIDPSKATGKDAVTLPHEMTHIQQFVTGNLKDRLEDTKLPYTKQKIEAGAESKGVLMQTRGNKDPSKSLEPLSTSEVEDTLKRTQNMNYTGFGDLSPEVQQELKDYMRHMIVKGNEQQGTAA